MSKTNYYFSTFLIKSTNLERDAFRWLFSLDNLSARGLQTSISSF